MKNNARLFPGYESAGCARFPAAGAGRVNVIAQIGQLVESERREIQFNFLTFVREGPGVLVPVPNIPEFVWAVPGANHDRRVSLILFTANAARLPPGPPRATFCDGLFRRQTPSGLGSLSAFLASPVSPFDQRTPFFASRAWSFASQTMLLSSRTPPCDSRATFFPKEGRRSTLFYENE